MPNTYTLKAIYEEVRISLGSSQVTVELDDKDLLKCLSDAVSVYNRNRPRRGKAAISAVDSKKKYGPLTHPRLTGVVDVNFVDTSLATSDVDPFDPNGIIYPHGQQAGDFQQQLTYMEDARRINSAEPEWHGQWEGKDYFLYISVGSVPMMCSYTYTWHVTPDENSVTGIQFIDEGDMDWIVAYTQAKAQMILARVRGKFGGIATTEGGVDQTDSAELMSEAREDILNLETEIKSRRRPLPPVIE